MEKQKKILFIHHAAGWGGAPNSMIKIINALDKSKYTVFVLLLKDSVVREKLEENNIPYKVAKSKFYKKFYKFFAHTVPNHTKWYNFYRLFILSISWVLSRYYYAAKELSDIEFDIAHLNSSVLTDWLAPCKHKGKVVIHIREPFFKGTIGVRHYFFKHQMQQYADKIIAISKDNADRVGLMEKTAVVYNYTTIKQARPSEQSYQSRKVLYVGGAGYIKGFHTLINALDYLEKDIKVLFAGNYPINRKKTILKQSIKMLIPQYRAVVLALQKMKKSDKVVEIGLVTDITPFLDEVCCLISPFVVVHFSRPIIEAFGSAKAVIATDIKGINEVVDNNINGFLVPKNNSKALAQAINYMCNNPTVAKEMGNAGYQKAVEHFSPTNVIQITTIYTSLLQ